MTIENNAVRSKTYVEEWNEKIDTVCTRHGMYPKLIQLPDGRYDFHSKVWQWFANNLNVPVDDKNRLLELLTFTTRVAGYSSLYKLIDATNREIENVTSEEESVTFEWILEKFKDRMTVISVWEESRIDDYREALIELINKMYRNMNREEKVFSAYTLTDNIYIPREYLEYIIVPEATAIMTHIKPCSKDYFETLKDYERKYLMIGCTTKPSTNQEVDEILDSLQEGKIVTIQDANLKIKYVPYYLSNQKDYTNQYKVSTIQEDVGWYCDEQELIENLTSDESISENNTKQKYEQDVTKQLLDILEERNDIFERILQAQEKSNMLSNAILESIHNKPIATSGYMRIVNPEPQEMKVTPCYSEGYSEGGYKIAEDMEDTDLTKEDEKLYQHLESKEQLWNRKFEKRLQEKFSTSYEKVANYIVFNFLKAYPEGLSGVKIKECLMSDISKDAISPYGYMEVWIPNASKAITEMLKYFRIFNISYYSTMIKYIVKRGAKGISGTTENLTGLILLILTKFKDDIELDCLK